MRSRFDFANVRPITFEEWRDKHLKSECCWGKPSVAEPQTFTTFPRCCLSTYGFELAGLKHECGSKHSYSLRRDYEDVRADGIDDYHVFFQAAGSATFMQNDRVSELAPGDAVLMDTGRPSIIVNNGGLLFDLVLPRRPLVSHVGLELQGGLRSPGDTAARRALRQLICNADDGEELSRWASGQIQRVIFDLVAVSFEPKLDPLSVPDAAFKRVCDIIRDRHTDPDLTPSMVAAEAAMSLRKLQTFFASRELTCTDYIQSVRLDHALFLLRRREFLLTNELLSQISWACGYRDHNYFARVFRRKFGQSPGAYAKSHRAK